MEQSSEAKIVNIPELPDRVFINEAGKFYKAKKAGSPADMESNLPTSDMLEVLDANPIPREEMVGKIIDLGNRRVASILAPETLEQS